MEVYKIENNTIPTLTNLMDGNYIKSVTCPNGDGLQIDGKGEVTSVPAAAAQPAE